MNEPVNATSFANVIKNQSLWCGIYQEQKRARKIENSRKQMARYYANKRLKEQQSTTA